MTVAVLAGVLAPPLVVLLSVALYVGLVHGSYARWHRRERRALPLSGVALLSAWAAEVAAAVRILWWRVIWLLARPRPTPGARPVVCVHGFGGMAADMLGFVRALSRRGRPAYSVSLGPPLAAIERWTDQLAASLRLVLDEHPDADGVDIVGHSMGGIVARLLLEKYPELASRVRTLVMLGSPNHGTAAVGRVAVKNMAQLRRGSPFLASLAHPGTAAPATRVLTFGAILDYIVYPSETCELEGVPHEILHAGHSGLVASSHVVDRVVEALTESEADR